MVSYTRNIQGTAVPLTLVEIDPDKVTLDPKNPRVGFSMRQLDDDERTDPACTLLLTSQEDTEGLMRSIILSGGVQEPIYVRHDMTVAEGNRRVVAMRAAKEEYPNDVRFQTLPAWVVPEGIPEHVIQDLLNEIHLGSVRGWAPYEKALQMRALLENGLVHEELAERYRMTAAEVRQHVEAANLMDNSYFPITHDPADSAHRAKFSYFLEFLKNTKLQKHTDRIPDLRERFAEWVRDEKVNTGAKVRRLTKVVEHEEALKLLERDGFDAAEQFVAKADPREQELYATIERVRTRLQQITVAELVELAKSDDRLEIMRDLQSQIASVIETAEQFSHNAAQRIAKRSTENA
jgi:hypothetical protein